MVREASVPGPYFRGPIKQIHPSTRDTPDNSHTNYNLLFPLTETIRARPIFPRTHAVEPPSTL